MKYISTMILALSVLSMCAFYQPLSARGEGGYRGGEGNRGNESFHREGTNVNHGNYYNRGANPEATRGAYDRGLNQGAAEGAAVGGGTTYYVQPPQQAPMQNSPTAPYQLAPQSSFN